MKFQYAYRDSQNERHDGLVVASSKDDAFKKLRAQGLKPFFLAPAPGLWNRLLGLGKRGAAIVVLSLACLAALYYARTTRKVADASAEFDAAINAQTRRQPIGDVAVIDQGVRSGWANVFELEGDRFLASFAVPGVPAGQRNTTEDEIRKALNQPRTTSHQPLTDSLEARQIVAMVEGMKKELRKYLSDGGTIREYGQELVKRQEAEIAYRQRLQNLVEEAQRSGKPEAAVVEELNACNQKLRRMGIRPLTMPEKVEFQGAQGPAGP